MMFDKVYDGPPHLESGTCSRNKHTLQSYSYWSNSIPASPTLLAVRLLFNYSWR